MCLWSNASCGFQGTVTGLQKHGAYVRITNYIKGLIPKIHLADVVLKNPEKLFNSGLKVKCRVRMLKSCTVI